MPEMIEFDLPKHQSSIIKVIGVGGGGSNAVNHMFSQGIKGVDFVISNTDSQALDISPIPTKIQLGTSLTEGRGAGAIPEIGKNAAMENIEEIKTILEKGTKMLFITAGMGGGTGTGAAPVIAAIAKEMNILSVGIVTIPFAFEGRKRKQQAELGIEELRQHVDTLLIISNDKLRELYGNLKLSEAFSKADDILATAAKGIAELITVAGYINVDFEDVNTVMKNSGVAIMGTGVAEGEDRALKAVEMALASPLLNDNNIKGANNVLLYIASGIEEIQMDEVSEITDYIQFEAGSTAEIIWGNGIDEELENKISVTLVATGFESSDLDFDNGATKRFEKKIVGTIEEEKPIEEEFPEIKIVKKEAPVHKPQKDTNLTFEFDIQNENIQNVENQKIDDIEEPVLVKKSIEYQQKQNEDDEIKDQERDELANRTQERINKLRDLSIKLKTPDGLAELEKEPAYIRRKVVLSDTVPSSESDVSKFTLSEGEDDNTEIKSNNSFLHDNVD